MKKILAFVLTMCMLFATVALADSNNQTITDASTDNTATTTLSVTLSESYTVVIPSELTITPGTVNTDLTVTVTSLRLAPDTATTHRVLRVAVDTENSATALTSENTDATIPFVISLSNSNIKHLDFDNNQLTRNFIIAINENDWKAAPATSYNATLKFIISLTDTTRVAN